MLLVVVRLPPLSPALVKTLTDAAGLAATEVRTRLAGALPRVLCMDADAERLQRIATALFPLGVTGVVCDARLVPTDADRLIARHLQWNEQGFSVGAGDSAASACPIGAVELFQRGTREHTDVVVSKSESRKFDAGRALMTGGLIMTRKQTTTEVRQQHRAERFVLIHRNDGEPDIMIYERRMDYRFLGTDMQPTATGNLQIVVNRLKALAPHVPFEDRVEQPGFVRGLPQTSVDRLDLGLFLVHLAERVRGAGYR